MVDTGGAWRQGKPRKLETRNEVRGRGSNWATSVEGRERIRERLHAMHHGSTDRDARIVPFSPRPGSDFHRAQSASRRLDRKQIFCCVGCRSHLTLPRHSHRAKLQIFWFSHSFKDADWMPISQILVRPTANCQQSESCSSRLFCHDMPCAGISDLPVDILVNILEDSTIPTETLYFLALLSRRLNYIALPLCFSRNGIDLETKSVTITLRAYRLDP